VLVVVRSRAERLPITDYRLPITDYRLPITDYRLPITDYRLPITVYFFPYLRPLRRATASMVVRRVLRRMNSGARARAM